MGSSVVFVGQMVLNVRVIAVNSVLSLKSTGKDYRFGTLLRVLKFLKVQIFIGRNKEKKQEVLSLF